MFKDFIDYIKDEFNFGKDEISNFENFCFLPLKKSIRVNTNKISIKDFKEIAKNKGWNLKETSFGKNTFYIDRFDDLDTALGNTLEHINGYFYIQEISASSSPFFMSGDKIDNNNYLILDMSSSPGGKTTQLAEYYPNSLIVANEINKKRLKGLFLNLNRLGAKNVVCTNYDGKFFKNYVEIFDKILLDAPCSGEGTAYKNENALKYWNIKNIKSISKLQLSLLDSAVKSLKVGGDLVYSTCTLNKIENEQVIEKILDRYKGNLEIKNIESKNKYFRNWPHIDKNGGFFVAKIRKIKSIKQKKIDDEKKLIDLELSFGNKKNKYFDKKSETKIVQNIKKLSSKETKLINSFLIDNFGFFSKEFKFYKFNNYIYLLDKNIDLVYEKFFLYKIGVKIGEFKDGKFIPFFYLGTIEKFAKNSFKVDLDTFYKLYNGETLDLDSLNISNSKDGFYQIFSKKSLAGIVFIKHNKIKMAKS